MALSGTLKDFGIADILQLIGHQTKTGRLTLKTGADEVEVFFVDGNVVFASEKARDSRDLLGSLLLRAELVSKERLDEALAIQQRTLNGSATSSSKTPPSRTRSSRRSCACRPRRRSTSSSPGRTAPTSSRRRRWARRRARSIPSARRACCSRGSGGWTNGRP